MIEADEAADVLLLGGRPLREPVAWYGPFVMNTKQEILDSLDLFETRRARLDPAAGGLSPERRPAPDLEGRGGQTPARLAIRRAEGRLTAPSPCASEHPVHSVWQGSRSPFPDAGVLISGS